jgi:RNA polymerase sigma-70 factor, ECF subfamily
MAEDIRPDIEKARNGDRGAFGVLVRKYQRRVYMTAYRMMGNHDDANDVAQEAFIRAFRGMSGFNARSDFFTWLYRIVINVSLNHLRKASKQRTVSMDDVQLPEPMSQAATSNPRKTVELRRKVAEVEQALETLPETLRATVVLVILEGMSYREAAEVLECSEGTVGWRVHEARKKLRDRLGKHLSTVGEEA